MYDALELIGGLGILRIPLFPLALPSMVLLLVVVLPLAAVALALALATAAVVAPAVAIRGAPGGSARM